jgi:hypothetical protein
MWWVGFEPTLPKESRFQVEVTIHHCTDSKIWTIVPKFWIRKRRRWIFIMGISENNGRYRCGRRKKKWEGWDRK